jgi:hypothetical protein
MDDAESRASWEIRRAAVARAIFCPVTGQVLDVRTAVLLESARRRRVLAVLSPQGWALREEVVRAALPDVVVTNAQPARESTPRTQSGASAKQRRRRRECLDRQQDPHRPAD